MSGLSANCLFEGVRLYIVSVNVSECTDCFLVSGVHHTHFGSVAGDNEKGRQGINDSFHYIHDVSRIQFSLEFTDKFSNFRLKRTNRHLDARAREFACHSIQSAAVRSDEPFDPPMTKHFICVASRL